MSCHGSHTWRVTIYTQDHSKTSSMQAIPTQEILPEIQQPDWTLGRQRLGNWQISGNHPMASTKENKAWKRTGGDKEHCMGIQASQSGDNIHVSIYPVWSTPLGLIAAWDQPNQPLQMQRISPPVCHTQSAQLGLEIFPSVGMKSEQLPNSKCTSTRVSILIFLKNQHCKN